MSDATEEQEAEALPVLPGAMELLHARMEIGMPVLYHKFGVRDPHSQPYPAMVMSVGREWLEVLVWEPGQKIPLSTFDGIRHIDDPSLSKYAANDMGSWELPNWLKTFFAAHLLKGRRGPRPKE